jgi:transposase-like protein
MADKRKVYSREFKVQAVALLNSSGKPGNQIEAELGIGQGTIYRWRRQLEESEELAFPGNGNERDKELAELRRENTELREEREILRESRLKPA